jgi:hypothetical protein
MIDMTWLGPKRWRLDADLVIGTTVTPAGFVFDGVSAPWALQWWINDTGEFLPAAIPHDYAYRTHCVTRREADDNFWAHALVHCGVRETKAYAAWLGLRAFGWWAWRKGG